MSNEISGLGTYIKKNTYVCLTCHRVMRVDILSGRPLPKCCGNTMQRVEHAPRKRDKAGWRRLAEATKEG